MNLESAKPQKFSFLLRCDECGQEVGFNGKLSRRHVGYSCPECGESMLSKKDFRRGKRLERLFGVLEFFGLAERHAGDQATHRVHTRERKITVTEIERD